MVEPTLYVDAGFSLASAAVFLVVGRRVHRRDVAAGAQRALTMFALWWYALGSSTLVATLDDVLAMAGVHDVAVYTTLTHLSLLLICVALLGLLHYLLFLFTGRDLILPLSIFYALYYGSLVYYIAASEPVGVTVGAWKVTLEYAHTPQGAAVTAILVLLVMPQILGALAYFTTFFRLEDPVQRYRVAVVSWSIILWFGISFVGAVGGLGQQDWWQVTSRVIGLLAAVAIYLAYEPPGFIQRRWDGASSPHQPT